MPRSASRSHLGRGEIDAGGLLESARAEVKSWNLQQISPATAGVPGREANFVDEVDKRLVQNLIHAFVPFGQRKLHTAQ